MAPAVPCGTRGRNVHGRRRRGGHSPAVRELDVHDTETNIAAFCCFARPGQSAAELQLAGWPRGLLPSCSIESGVRGREAKRQEPREGADHKTALRPRHRAGRAASRGVRAVPKLVYDFKEGNKDLKDLLGGKGANLAEMTNLGLPVPPGFIIDRKSVV